MLSPACRADPVVGGVPRHLTAQHARLQPGQERFGLGERKPDLRERVDDRRPAERDQLRRFHLALVRPRLQPHRPPHHARPRSQASARSISPGQASGLPQVFDAPCRRSGPAGCRGTPPPSPPPDLRPPRGGGDLARALAHRASRRRRGSTAWFGPDPVRVIAADKSWWRSETDIHWRRGLGSGRSAHRGTRWANPPGAHGRSQGRPASCPALCLRRARRRKPPWIRTASRARPTRPRAR